MMHTAESDSAVRCIPQSFFYSNISEKSKQNSQILQPVCQGPRWVQIMKKTEGRKSRDTLPLTLFLDIIHTSFFSCATKQVIIERYKATKAHFCIAFRYRIYNKILINSYIFQERKISKCQVSSAKNIIPIKLKSFFLHIIQHLQ